jgi:hypothetical protein
MTQIAWLARLLTPEGTAVASHAVALQMFDLATGWRQIAAASTGGDGTLRGKADDGIVKAIVAPMLRLVEGADPNVVLGGIPRLTAAGSPVTLSADFGEIMRIVEARFAAKRVASARSVDDPSMVGGIAAPVGARAAIAAAFAPAKADTAPVASTKELETRLGERDLDVVRLKTERDDLAARLVDSEGRLAKMRDTATAGTTTNLDPKATGSLPTRSSSVSLGDFATRIGGEVDSAQVALKARGFSLGTISVTARTVMTADTLHFPDAEELKTMPAGAFSDVAITLNPAPAITAGQGVQVPDIRQLTESAARRVLASVGLTIEASQGPAGIAPDCAPGQAMLQAPKPGSTVARGSAVLVVFARVPGT